MKPYICTAQLFSKSGRCLAHLCRERTRLHGRTNTRDISCLLALTALTAATHSTQHQKLRFTATLRNNGCFCLFFQNPQLLLSRRHRPETSSRYASPWPLPEFLFCCLELTATDGLGCPQAPSHSTPRVRFAPSWTFLAVWRRRNPPQVPAAAVFGAIEVLGAAIWG
jgi:hypothetical protein